MTLPRSLAVLLAASVVQAEGERWGLITEMVDPADDKQARYVEMYFPELAGCTVDEDLSLVTTFDGVQGKVELYGSAVPEDGFVIACVNPAHADSIFGEGTCDREIEEVQWMDGDAGTFAFAIIRNQGQIDEEIIELFGEIGTDGTDVYRRDFTDGFVQRGPYSCAPGPDYMMYSYNTATVKCPDLDCNTNNCYCEYWSAKTIADKDTQSPTFTPRATGIYDGACPEPLAECPVVTLTTATPTTTSTTTTTTTTTTADETTTNEPFPEVTCTATWNADCSEYQSNRLAQFRGDYTAEECAEVCAGLDGCAGFQLGLSGKRAGDCLPVTAGCTAGGNANWDFYDLESDACVEVEPTSQPTAEPTPEDDDTTVAPVEFSCPSGPTFTADCKEYKAVRMTQFKDQDYTAEECATICDGLEGCAGFQLGVSGRGSGWCLPVTAGCTTEGSNPNWEFYDMSACQPVSETTTSTTTEVAVDCLPTWTGDCKEYKSLRMDQFTDQFYSVEECWEICAGLEGCAGFQYGVNGRAGDCLPVEAGCATEGRSSNWDYYAMETANACYSDATDAPTTDEPATTVPLTCTATWNADCSEYQSNRLAQYKGEYTAEECAEVCAGLDGCAGFQLGLSGKRAGDCLPVTAGCTAGGNANWAFYDLNDCPTTPVRRLGESRKGNADVSLVGLMKRLMAPLA